MMDIAATLRARLAALTPAVVEIHDDSAEHAGHAGAAGGGGHFSLIIVSEQFSGQNRLARHRAVLDRVGDLIPHPNQIEAPEKLMRRDEPQLDLFPNRATAIGVHMNHTTKGTSLSRR